MKRILAVTLLLAPFMGACADQLPLPPLPELSAVGFDSGRVATEEDFKSGSAVFLLKDGDTLIGEPIAIELPQYAYMIEDGRKIPVVVVQAENARGKQLVGGIDGKGTPVIGILSEFELLGNVNPSASSE